MNILPHVAVVIPVYGRTDTLRDAIESVFLQDYGGLIEIIVVDDASASTVYDCLVPYLDRLKYIRMDKNIGVAAARNEAILQTHCPFITFLDSDDIFLPSKIRLQITNLVSKKLSISHTNEFWFKRDRFVNQGKRHKRYGGFIFPNVLDICRVSPSSLMVKRDVFDKVGLFDETLRVCEDYEWTLRASLFYEFDYLEEKLLVKRAVTDNSLSNSIKHIESLRLNILKNFKQVYGHNLSANNLLALEAELTRKELIVKS